MKEEWKNIEGYEGLYQVSSLGRIKSLPREINGTLGGSYTTPEKILSPPVYSNGYVVVKLYNDGECERYGVHVLVARAFIPNTENKPIVNHKDGNKQNNHWGNLEWATQQENHTHAAENGLKAIGERVGPSKLTTESVRVIKSLLLRGVPQRKIAEQFSVCQASIKDINRGNTWGHVKI